MLIQHKGMKFALRRNQNHHFVMLYFNDTKKKGHRTDFLKGQLCNTGAPTCAYSDNGHVSWCRWGRQSERALKGTTIWTFSWSRLSLNHFGPLACVFSSDSKTVPAAVCRETSARHINLNNSAFLVMNIKCVLCVRSCWGKQGFFFLNLTLFACQDFTKHTFFFTPQWKIAESGERHNSVSWKRDMFDCYRGSWCSDTRLPHFQRHIWKCVGFFSLWGDVEMRKLF